MTTAGLQALAFFTMLIDHLGYCFFPGAPVLRAVGRLSFPIFAFLLSEGFVHTRDLKKYLGRLLFFAVVSEAPYQLMIYRQLGFGMKNILFALFVSLLVLWCVKKGGPWLFGAAGLVVFAQIGGLSYGAYGVLLCVCFYVFREKRPLGLLCLVALTLLYCAQHHSLFQVWAVLAAVPLFFYNGQRGRRAPKYLLYILYPVHLALYAGIWFLQNPGNL